ncbi:MAG: hypothetical protein RMY64_26005 [Nostoc sp. DedQUE08]|uniref:hypothetical protein n=1 Tax=Nostoc sp. DedQUE08 TaxID=3075393 RepID=UPI002AD58D44|nr:hypothetical protein [Nostoc sp. DedQUE08]MDZ8069026.1 hypothetical protein [Nostoc sp. DedQUE08]
MPSAPSKQRSQLNESVISPISSQQLKKSNIKVDLYICDARENVGIVKNCCSTFFVVDWETEKDKWYFWERDELYIAELALAQPAAGIAPQCLIDKFLEDKSEPLVLCPSCELQHIYLSGGCGMCGLAPANFLEETEGREEVVQKPKGRQRIGCLYKYIENKKLKNGSIASYPRVIGHRQTDNPTHWRWGFNWEEKIDGEWKGRSIGSIPVGAITLIQSMQKEGVSLEEIIDFIRRAKAKKS